MTWTLGGEYDDEYEASCAAYKELARITASPVTVGQSTFVVTNDDTGESQEMHMLDGVVEVEPLLASQIIGFRHFIWVQQNPPRSNKK